MSDLTAFVRSAVSTKGFVTVPSVITEDFALDLRSVLERCVEEDLQLEDETRAVDRYMVLNLMFRDPAFRALYHSPRLLEALDAVLTETSLIYAYTSSSMPPKGDNYSGRVHVDSPRIVPGYPTNVGLIVALDDFTEQNGATYFLPGSFERAEPLTEEEFFAGAERAFPKRGDMVIFNARTWHYGGMNTTDTWRHAVTINACRSFMRQRFDYPRMTPAALIPELTDTDRRLLGFNVRVPASLAEYYVPEAERLYKANQG